jgi:hypothetical protein
MPQHLKFEKQITGPNEVLIKRQDRWNKSQHSRELRNTIKWVCKHLIKHFGEMKWNVLHARDIFVIFALGPFVSNTYFQVLGTSFEASSRNKVYSIVTTTNSVTNQYKEWFFWLIEISMQRIFHGKKWPKYSRSPVKKISITRLLW